jgi:hypothetical protein
LRLTDFLKSETLVEDEHNDLADVTDTILETIEENHIGQVTSKVSWRGAVEVGHAKGNARTFNFRVGKGTYVAVIIKTS